MMQARRIIDKSIDGARILWRMFLASNDVVAQEGHVREFSPDGEYVRLSATEWDTDCGQWLRASDLRLVAVLADNVPVKTAPKRKYKNYRVEGDEWKDGTDDLDLGGPR